MPTLKVTRADNEVYATLNGLVVYDKKTDNNPVLNDQVELSPYLAAGLNILVVTGINWGGSAIFTGSVVVGSIETPFAFNAATTPNGVAFTKAFVIPK